MFTELNHKFTWADLGDIELGRPNLGSTTEVAVYRLLQFTLRNVLIDELGPEEASRIFQKAGHLAGFAFCENVLDRSLEFPDFMADLQDKLRSLNIGILRMEESDLETMRFVMTVAEDLDCSGLPASGEEICDYDEGFIAGILKAFTGQDFEVKEVDCWASGGRVCRFAAEPVSV